MKLDRKFYVPAGYWTLTLVNTETGDRAYSEKHDTRHGALSEEDDLMAHLQKRVNNRKEQQS